MQKSLLLCENGTIDKSSLTGSLVDKDLLNNYRLTADRQEITSAN